jgi:hypothetical protein
MLQKLTKTCDIAGHLNGRTEKHGEEDVPAFDVRVTISLTRNQLNKFTGNDQLWTSWFLESKTDGDKPLLEHWQPYRWKPKFEACKVSLTVGGVNRETIELGECKLKGFIFTPQKGGQTECSFTVQALASTKNCVMLLHIGEEDASIEIEFGELVLAQQELKLNGDPDEDDDEASRGSSISEQPPALN